LIAISSEYLFRMVDMLAFVVTASYYKDVRGNQSAEGYNKYQTTNEIEISRGAVTD
jgi:hypothetical protein